MSASEFVQRLWRKAYFGLYEPASILRRLVWQIRGAKIGRSTRLPKCMATWPHQVRIGELCVLQPGIFFNFDHYWIPGPSIIVGDRVFIGKDVEFNCREKITVGDDALIGAGCRLIDSDHGTDPGRLIRLQEPATAAISVGNGAWLGANVIVLKGVKIGDGAVIGAGSIVTKSVPSGEVWAGSPAKFLRSRDAG
ncbi:MAG: acyltransferase [Terrimicrobiaceae bacterium]